jgi:CBS domain-containing protein
MSVFQDSSNVRVCDVMTTHVYCCAAGDTVQMAARIMQLHNAGILPVVDNDYCVAGVITERDICSRVTAEGLAPSTRVYDCMTMNPVRCHPGQPVSQALDAMQRSHIRRVLVTDSEGVLLGIVSITDLVRRDLVDPAVAYGLVERIPEPWLRQVEIGDGCC